MPFGRLALAAAAVLIVAGACSGAKTESISGSPSAPSMSEGQPDAAVSPSPLVAPPGCVPHGSNLQLKAPGGTSFDTKCLAAPADSQFTIRFDNVQSTFAAPHNVSIYTDATATVSLFTGKILQNGKETVYRVAPIPAGVYLFQCDLHPALMTGVLVVK